MENLTNNLRELNWTTYQYFEYNFNFVRISVFALCFIANLLTLTAVIRFDNLHKKPPNILIFSLAIADASLGFNSITITLIMLYHGPDTLSEVSCYLHVWFSRASILGNIMTIFLISIERTLAIFFPLKSIIWITASKTKKLVFLLWILITCQTTLEVVLGGHYDSTFPCNWRMFFSKGLHLSIAIVSPVYALVPFILNIAIYIKIKCTIKRRNKLGTNVSNTSRKTTKMMAILMGTYYGFYVPAFLDYLLNYDPNIKRYLQHIFEVVFYFNAIANPIIYAWMNKEFNVAFRKILRIKNPSNSNIEFVTGTSTTFLPIT